MKEIKEDYGLFNPYDTQKLLKENEVITKKRQKGRKEWYYTSSEITKNVALIFSKFIPHTLKKDEEKENKDKYLQLVINEIEYLCKNYRIFQNIHTRYERTITNTGFILQSFKAKTSWRLVIGLGASHPQETSMTLHHIYGIPYIPGSAIKGVTRHWAVLKFAEKHWNSTKSTEKNGKKFEDSIAKVAKELENGNDLDMEVNGIAFKDLIEIFGTQTQQGKLIFFDAYPDGNINFKIDIMNPHYPQYYSEGHPPTDWQNPVPIKFLTIENTEFKFYLAVRDANYKDLLEKAKKLLSEALKEYGIGAKTSLGYGIFEV